MTTSGDMRLDDLSARFDKLARDGAPGVRGLAAWLADHTQELAFHSVRGLAEVTRSDPNVVVRCMKAAGFTGFSEARRTVQNCLRTGHTGYGPRIDALQNVTQTGLLKTMAEAAQLNARKAFSQPLDHAIEELVPHLLAARRVHCIGVRMAYALALLFTYRGAIAHANVVPTPAQPGLILDSLIATGPEDVVILISFAHYSAETLRAAAVAKARGARVLAITDSRSSPLVEGAWRSLRAPVEGPHVMYSVAGATMIIETLLELMLARDPQASARIEAFERSLLEVGAYAGLPALPRK